MTWNLAQTMSLIKAAQHKYTHRKMIGRDPKTNRIRYRYYYAEHHGGGITGASFEEGSAFKLTYKGRRGHFHVQRVEGDKVYVKHDGRPNAKEVELTKSELRALLKRQHETTENTKREKAQEARRGKKRKAKTAPREPKTSREQMIETAQQEPQAPSAKYNKLRAELIDEMTGDYNRTKINDLKDQLLKEQGPDTERASQAYIKALDKISNSPEIKQLINEAAADPRNAARQSLEMIQQHLTEQIPQRAQKPEDQRLENLEYELELIRERARKDIQNIEQQPSPPHVIELQTKLSKIKPEEMEHGPQRRKAVDQYLALKTQIDTTLHAYKDGLITAIKTRSEKDQSEIQTLIRAKQQEMREERARARESAQTKTTQQEPKTPTNPQIQEANDADTPTPRGTRPKRSRELDRQIINQANDKIGTLAPQDRSVLFRAMNKLRDAQTLALYKKNQPSAYSTTNEELYKIRRDVRDQLQELMTTTQPTAQRSLTAQAFSGMVDAIKSGSGTQAAQRAFKTELNKVIDKTESGTLTDAERAELLPLAEQLIEATTGEPRELMTAIRDQIRGSSDEGAMKEETQPTRPKIKSREEAAEYLKQSLLEELGEGHSVKVWRKDRSGKSPIVRVYVQQKLRRGWSDMGYYNISDKGKVYPNFDRRPAGMRDLAADIMQRADLDI